MKKRSLYISALCCCFVCFLWWWTLSRDRIKVTQNFTRNDSATIVPSASSTPAVAKSARSSSDREDPGKVWEAIEALNVPMNLWGKVVDQDNHPLGEARIEYDYSIEHGNMQGVAWSNQERRTGEVLTTGDGLFSIQGLTGHTIAILGVSKKRYQFRMKGGLIFNFYGDTSEGKFIPRQETPVLLTMIQEDAIESLVHVKGSLRVRGDGTPEGWNLWEGKSDPNGELIITLRREPAVLDRLGQAATWTADLKVVGGGIIEALWDEDVRRAPESGYLAIVAYPEVEQKRGVPERSFYLKTADGRFGRIQVHLYARDEGSTARCFIAGDMNPRPGSRNLEPTDEE